MKKIAILFCCLFASSVLHAQTVWVVRHAEKSTAVYTADPELSAEGKVRAAALADYLSKEKIDEIYSTPFVRTRSTVAGVAAANGLQVKTYDKPADLAAQVWSGNPKKKVLIAGHSNTVPDILRALGAEYEVKELKDADYDYIFKVSRSGKKIGLVAGQYGAAHRATP